MLRVSVVVNILLGLVVVLLLVVVGRGTTEGGQGLEGVYGDLLEASLLSGCDEFNGHDEYACKVYALSHLDKGKVTDSESMYEFLEAIQLGMASDLNNVYVPGAVDKFSQFDRFLTAVGATHKDKLIKKGLVGRVDLSKVLESPTFLGERTNLFKDYDKDLMYAKMQSKSRKEIKRHYENYVRR